MKTITLGLLSLVLVLTACGGGSSADPSPPPPPPPPPPPAATASFTAASTCTAMMPLAFDASASTSSDGSTLVYRWNFGDGQLGSGVKIAHAFATAGSYSVTLTVTDTANRSATASKSVTVTAGNAPGPSISVLGVIHGVDGLAIDGVTATAPDGATATSNAMGKLTISLGTDVPLLVHLAKSGYADQFVSVTMPHTAGADAEFQAVMRPRNAAQSLDAAAGGSLTTSDGAKLTLPANGIVDGAGAAVSGSIDVAMTPVDVTLPGGGGFPGSYDGVNTDASTTPLVSFGTTEFVLSRNGQRLQVAPGKTATIELPLAATRKIDGTAVAVGDSIPLWSLDEKTGAWISEGSGTVVASTSAPGGLAMRAQVAHFSWWNVDLGFDPYGPRPDCREDTAIGLPQGAPAFATATFCNFLAEFERTDETTGKLGPAKAAAAAAAPRPGYSRRAVVAVPGGPGDPMPVPPNVNLVLSATALNGTWTGRTVINGPVGRVETITVLMRPIAVSGAEDITLPFQGTRSLSPGQAGRFNFTGGAPKYALVQVARSNSNLTGTVKLLRGGTVLASADFGASTANFGFPLQESGTYTIEVTSTSDTAGAYQLTASLAGEYQDESTTLPLDVSRTLDPYVTRRIGFDVSGTTSVLLNLKNTGSLDVTQRLRDSSGTVLNTLTTTSVVVSSAQLTLPTGHYVAEVTARNGGASQFRTMIEPTSFVLAGPTLPMTSNANVVDLQADRNGAPVVAYQRSIDDGVSLKRTVILQRLVNGTWSQVGTNSPTIAKPCTAFGEAFAFDANNLPVIAYVERAASGDTTSTRVVRFDGNAWIAVGPDDGRLPGVDSFGAACQNRPVVRVAPGGAIAVARMTDSGIDLRTFDGSNWVGFASNAGDIFPTTVGSVDMRFDAEGRAVIAYGNGQSVAVRRLTGGGAPFEWQQLGSSSTLPLGTLFDLRLPRLRFDASGQPILAMYAGVPTGELTFTGGLAVFRFESGDWHTLGGYRPMNSGVVGTTSLPGPGFTYANGEALLAFVYSGASGTQSLVQRNTAAAWSPVGADLGQVPQLYAHDLSTSFATGGYLLESAGADTWLAVVVKPGEALTDLPALNLFKLVR